MITLIVSLQCLTITQRFSSDVHAISGVRVAAETLKSYRASLPRHNFIYGKSDLPLQFLIPLFPRLQDYCLGEPVGCFHRFRDDVTPGCDLEVGEMEFARLLWWLSAEVGSEEGRGT